MSKKAENPLPSVPLPKRGRPSLVATHPHRAAIEQALANGVGLKILAAKYGIGVDVLSRYKNKMPPELKAALRVRPMKSDEELAELRELESRSLMDNLVWQRGRLYANADMSRELGDLAGERAALAEAGKATERIAKLLGELGTVIKHDHRHVHLAATPEWHAIRVELVRALKPYPEAHAAVVAAIQRAEAIAAGGMAVIDGEVQRVRERVEQRTLEAPGDAP